MSIKFEPEELIPILGGKGIHLLDIEQRTDRWIDVRKYFFTASEMPEIMISFINKESFMRNNRADFARYKLGQKEKEFNEFQTRLMERGKLNEPVAIAEIDKMVTEYNSENPDEKLSLWQEPVFIKDNWALASTDCMLYYGGSDNYKLFAPVEIKYTEYRSTFNKYMTKNHYNFYQLAFQMYVTGTEIGYMTVTLNEFNKPMETVTVEIDTESIYYKEVIAAIKEVKKLHKDICIKRKNPIESKEAEAILSGLALFNQEIASEMINKELKNLLDNAFTTKVKLDEVNARVDNAKKSFIHKMKESGTYTCKLENQEVQYILCSKDNSYYVMKKPLIKAKCRNE